LSLSPEALSYLLFFPRQTPQKKKGGGTESKHYQDNFIHSENYLNARLSGCKFNLLIQITTNRKYFFVLSTVTEPEQHHFRFLGWRRIVLHKP
jgi:hypothetical protein